MTERTLIVLPVSPWTERARWALDHHGVAYKKETHAPMLGERRLRKLSPPGKVRATVPILVESDGRAICESIEIARHAESIGTGSKLFPAESAADIERIVKLCDDITMAGRAVVTAATYRTGGALDEQLPPFIPQPVRPLLRPFARQGVKWFANKYGLDLDDTSAPLAVVRKGLAQLQEEKKEKEHYFGSFTYADIAAASVLQFARPVQHARYPLWPGSRQAWTNEELAREFSGLLAWRDALYAQFRG